MKICLVVEGAYPYVQGGVSSWVNTLMRQMPQHEFVLQTIAASRSESGKFKYTFPDNLIAVNESFLLDGDYVSKRVYKSALTKQEKDALRSLVFCEDEQWGAVFDMFYNKQLSVNDILMGKDFFDIVFDLYNEQYSRIVFTDFLWTMRSVFMPIFIILKNKFVKADIYHTMSTGYAGIVACCAGHIYKKPVLLTEHGIYTREREEEIIRASWTKGVYKDLWINHFYMLSRCIYEKAERVFSIFGRARELQIEIGCREEKTEVIHNGIDYKGFSNLPGKEIDDGFVDIGAIIRVTPIKDVKTLINAFSLAKEKVENLRLLIIGNTEEDPIYYQECVDLIGMLGAKDIIFTGHVNTRDYIGKIDIMILTSISEGQPLSLLEAMAAGKPCIATNVGDCFDMLNAGDDEGNAGIVVPVMNVGQIALAMQMLAEDKEMRERLGGNGRVIVEKYYDQKQFISRYDEIYNQIYAMSAEHAQGLGNPAVPGGRSERNK